MNNRFKIAPHNYGTDENPVFTDWEDIIDTYDGEVVYTQHSLMCAHLLKEINNPEEHNIEHVDKYISKVNEMEKNSNE